MQVIICDINLFTLTQQIQVIDTVSGDIVATHEGELVDLPADIHNACIMYSIPKVHLFGETKYVTDLQETLYAYNQALTYSTGKIKNLEIEVN